jgi:hypothetical protein
MLEAIQIPNSSASGAEAGQGRQPSSCDRFIAAKPERLADSGLELGIGKPDLAE